MAAAEVRVTLPDGSEKRLPVGATGADLAQAIGPGLAKAAVAARVDGQVWDLTRRLPDGVTVAILTERDRQALDVLRHSSAHVLATAVRQLFPHAKIGFGPPIEDGFYYDFEVPTPFTPEDLERIEAKMHEVVRADYPFVREEVDRAEAKRRFADDPLKLERIEDLGPNEVISVYTDGPFVDLCRGPHVASTGKIKHFKLLHAAGAYWRGDERRQMLQRIYGTAWFTKDDLEAYLRRLEEAKKRDHRLLGRQLDLFSIQEDVGPGLIFWHPKGAMMQFQLRRFIEDVILERGYQLVYTPNLTREELFLRSGHLPLYAANQFPPMAAGEGEGEGVHYRVKPMNCPMHILIYAAQQRSYRDLPIRLAEIANVYRNERSGTLHGMLRVRGLTMDDAHIFLREDQIEQEIFQLLDIVELVLGKTFGLSYRLDLATRPEKKLGTDATWDQAEGARAGAQAPRRYLPHRSGRRRVLRTKDRRQVQRRHRPGVAGCDDPARLRTARTLPARVRGRGQQAAPPGDDPPRDLRHAGAVLRLSDRALRRSVSAVARPRAGTGAADLGRPDSRGTRCATADRGRRPPCARGRAQRDAELQDPRRRDAQGAVYGGRGAAGGGCRDGRGAGTGGGAETGRAAGRPVRRAPVRRAPDESARAGDSLI